MIDPTRFAQVMNGFRLFFKLDESGLSFFEQSYAGFVRSFFPALILAPLHAVHHAAVYMSESPTPSLPVTVIVESLTYIVSVTLFPFVMLYVARFLGKSDRYYAYIVPYNWLQLPVGLILLPLTIMTDFHFVSTDAASALNLIVLGLYVMYGTFLALIALDMSTSTAFGIVVLDILLTLLSGTLIDQIPRT